MSNPKVSVLIGAYNAELWIGETLRSVLRQTYRNLEVVVVDDGSTDDTVASARQAVEGSEVDVRVLTQPNRGACAARNHAFRASTGSFVQYLDADDLLHPEKIEKQIQRLTHQPPGAVATGPWARFRDEVPDLDAVTPASDWQDYDPATEWLVQSWSGDGTIPLFSWLIPRDVAEAAGPWAEGLLRNQDGEYMSRILVRSRQISFCEGAWGFYRSAGPGSVSARKSEAALRSLYEATERCERVLLEHEDTPTNRRACSGMWQQFLFTAYPNVPDLIQHAERRVEALGGMYRKPGVSRPLRVLRDRLGWKVALHIQHLYNRVRS